MDMTAGPAKSLMQHRWTARHQTGIRVAGIALFVACVFKIVWWAALAKASTFKPSRFPLDLGAQAVTWGWLLPSECDRKMKVLEERP